MKQVIAEFTNYSDRGLWKVFWSYGNTVPGGRPYQIEDVGITQRSVAVRLALQEVVEEGRKRKLAQPNNTPSQYDELVRQTAKAGFQLYEALFFGDSTQDKKIAAQVRDWLEQHLTPGEDTITFRLPSRIHFPWGLIYDQPVKPDTDPSEFKKHFWCEKYSTTVHYFFNQPQWEEKAWPRPPFAILFAADQDLWSATLNSVGLEEKERLLALLGHPPQPLFKIDHISEQWNALRKKSPHALLTFYCHATGDKLSIDGKTVSSYDLEQMFVSDDDSPPSLVFLAGCNTAVGELYNGFFKATAAEGYCGFVGTEVKVPDIFTLRFLARFFDRFFSKGESVAQVMHELRMKHWPLSLVFSVCCCNGFRLEPASGAMKPNEDLNLSQQTVASQ
jgi:CHAT domain